MMFLTERPRKKTAKREISINYENRFKNARVAKNILKKNKENVITLLDI